MNFEKLQRDHYNNILSEYDAHYDDKFSQEYRSRFIYKWLFDGIDLKGQKVLEAMCGSGQVTKFLLSAGADVTGLDISETAIASFRERWPDCPAVCGSILKTKFEDNFFDRVVIIGGLHHIHPHINEAVKEICRILKKGGYLCFVEPHKGSLPDIFRKFWYKHDKLFLKNEASVDMDNLKREFSSSFRVMKERYAGNIAYLFVLNSMIFRIPIWLKSVYAPVLLTLESATERIMTKKSSCFIISQWQKT